MKSTAFLARRSLFAGVVLAAFAACAPLEAKAPEEGASTAAAPVHLESLEIVTARGPVRFQVEIADDDEERARGLMFRTHLPDDRGMLFDFQSAAPRSFWMRNTFIPLDIIFIAQDGYILNIARQTTPFSEAPIPSLGPALGVLEIRGGLAAELGVEPGDKVRHRIFPG